MVTRNGTSRAADLRERSADNRVRNHEPKSFVDHATRRALHAAWHWLVAELTVAMRQARTPQEQQSAQSEADGVLAWLRDRAVRLNERNRT